MENPKIRFKGFTKDWEQRKLGEVSESYSGGTPSVGNKSYYGGSIPFIRSAEINSESTELFLTEEGLTNSSARMVSKGDILYALYGATSGETGRSRINGAINQAILAILPHDGYDSEFLMQWLRKSKQNITDIYLQGGQGNLSGAIVKALEVNFPSLAEQRQIGNYFQSIDKLITLHQRKCEQTKKLKKYMLQKMFPQNGAKVPEIRFYGFTYDWEQRKLSELLEKYEDPVETPHDGYERVGIRSHAKGTFHSFVEPGKELDTAKMYRVAADKFILNITFAWEHAVAITDNNDAGKLVSHRFPQFSFNPKLKPHFFKYLMLDKKFREHLELSSPGGAGRNRVLKISHMLKYEIKLPSVEEQIKIGEYFDSLDHLITLHQRKCDELKKMKKYMLQNMFI